MGDPPPCYLLEKIPAELRNRIYELTFAPDDEKNETGEVNLCKAKPPAKDLIMTCRQIHSEAAKMYKAEYQQYWRATQFAIFETEARDYVESLDALKEEDIEQVRRLRIEELYFWTMNYHFIPEARAWKRICASWSDVFILPKLSASSISEDRTMSTQHFDTSGVLMAYSATKRQSVTIKDQILWLALDRYSGCGGDDGLF